MNAAQNDEFWRRIDEYADIVKAGGPPSLIADAADPIHRYIDWHVSAKDTLLAIITCCHMALQEGADKTEMLMDIERRARGAWAEE